MFVVHFSLSSFSVVSKKKYDVAVLNVAVITC
jgi:hypothetical protein